MVVNLIVSILLAKSLGVAGVIIGTLAGYGITGPLYVRLALRELSVGAGDFLRNGILPILPWAAIFAGVVALTAVLLNPEPCHRRTVLRPGQRGLRGRSDPVCHDG